MQRWHVVKGDWTIPHQIEGYCADALTYIHTVQRGLRVLLNVMTCAGGFIHPSDVTGIAAPNAVQRV
jgi:hypothetical protein